MSAILYENYKRKSYLKEILTRQKQLEHHFVSYLDNFIILLQKTLQNINCHLTQEESERNEGYDLYEEKYHQRIVIPENNSSG